MATARIAADSLHLPARPQEPAPKPEPKEQQPEWETLERQDWHLWLLALLLMAVLGVSLLSFMFPATFWFGDELAVKSPGRAFFGFTLLLALALVYMLQRQSAIRRLKRRLYQAQAAVTQAERAARVQAFLSLPETGQFRDLLAMEYLRASRSHEHLAILLLSPPHPAPHQLGQATILLRDMLRRRESVFRIAQQAFAIILPGMSKEEVSDFDALVRERLLPVCPQLATQSSVYPEQVSSLAEFDALLRDVMTEGN